MKKILPLYYIFLFLTLLRQDAKSEIANPFFLRQYDNRNGLSNSSINYIFKDTGNLLWVATRLYSKP